MSEVSKKLCLPFLISCGCIFYRPEQEILNFNDSPSSQTSWYKFVFKFCKIFLFLKIHHIEVVNSCFIIEAILGWFFILVVFMKKSLSVFFLLNGRSPCLSDKRWHLWSGLVWLCHTFAELCDVLDLCKSSHIFVVCSKHVLADSFTEFFFVFDSYSQTNRLLTMPCPELLCQLSCRATGN